MSNHNSRIPHTKDNLRKESIYNVPGNNLSFMDKIETYKQDFSADKPHHYIHQIYAMDTKSKDKYITVFQKYKSLRRTLMAVLTLHRKKLQKDPNAKISYLEEIRKTHFQPIKAHWIPFVASTKSYRRHEPQGQTTLGSKINFNIDTTDTQFIGDGCIRLKLKGLSAISSTNKVKYVDRLGERIVKDLTFKINSKPEQSVNGIGMNFFYNKILPHEKKVAWDRAIRANGEYVGILNENPAGSGDDVEQYIILNTGSNVYKNSHSEIDIIIPLIFFFNNDTTPLRVRRYSSYSFSIELTLASAQDCYRVINYDDPDDSFPTDQPSYITAPTVEASMYLAHISTSEDVDEAIYGSSEAQLVRYTKQTQTSTVSPEGHIKLDGVGGFVERMIIGFRPQSNTLSTNEGSYSNWYKCSSITTSSFETPTYNGSAVEYTPVIYHKEDPLIDNYCITLKSAPITTELPIKMEEYKAIFQHHTTQTNKDRHLIDVDFRVGYEHSNPFQPTGYVHAPTGNELSIKYDGTTISSSTPTFIDCIAIQLAFLIVDPETQQMTLKHIL